VSHIKDSIAECVPQVDPLARPFYTEAEIQALRAVWEGQATERQQRMSMEYMIRAFGVHDTSFRPGDPYLTAFAEGRRYAGTTLVWMLKAAPTRTDPDKIASRNLEQG